MSGGEGGGEGADPLRAKARRPETKRVEEGLVEEGRGEGEGEGEG